MLNSRPFKFWFVLNRIPFELQYYGWRTTRTSSSSFYLRIVNKLNVSFSDRVIENVNGRRPVLLGFWATSDPKCGDHQGEIPGEDFHRVVRSPFCILHRASPFVPLCIRNYPEICDKKYFSKQIDELWVNDSDIGSITFNMNIMRMFSKIQLTLKQILHISSNQSPVFSASIYQIFVRRWGPFESRE